MKKFNKPYTHAEYQLMTKLLDPYFVRTEYDEQLIFYRSKINGRIIIEYLPFHHTVIVRNLQFFNIPAEIIISSLSKLTHDIITRVYYKDPVSLITTLSINHYPRQKRIDRYNSHIVPSPEFNT